MKLKYLSVVLIFLSGCLFAQNDPKDTYLKQNQFDIESGFSTDFNFKSEVKMVGFGAYHGSAKTEDVELSLFKHVANNGLKYYFPEMDFSMAHYFQLYCDSPNDSLLKDLIIHYGVRVPQESTIEVFKKWKTIAPIISSKNIQIVGVDPIMSFKYTMKYLLEIVDQDWVYKVTLKKMLSQPYFVFNPSEKLHSIMEEIYVYLKNNNLKVSDEFVFSKILADLETRFSKNRPSRDHQMYQNYTSLNEKFHFRNELQFVRMGVGHLYKSGGSFLSKIIANNVLRKNEIYAINGLLYKSKAMAPYFVKTYLLKNPKNVVFFHKTTLRGKCKTKGTRNMAGNSILESQVGIKSLVRNRLSNITFFELTKQDNNPYSEKGVMDFIHVKKFLRKKPRNENSINSTTHNLDAVVLISNSESSNSIHCLCCQP